MKGFSQEGQSLFEMMVVVTLVMLMSAFALPPLFGIINKNVIRSERLSLYQDLRTVRHAAITRNRSAYLCAMDSSGSCFRSANWQGGWLGYVDDNHNGIYDAPDELLLTRTGPKASQGVAIILHARWKDIKIDGRGILRRSGHFRICDPHNSGEQLMNVIRMNAFGRLAIESDTLVCR